MCRSKNGTPERSGGKMYVIRNSIRFVPDCTPRSIAAQMFYEHTHDLLLKTGIQNCAHLHVRYASKDPSGLFDAQPCQNINEKERKSLTPQPRYSRRRVKKRISEQEFVILFLGGRNLRCDLPETERFMENLFRRHQRHIFNACL